MPATLLGTHRLLLPGAQGLILWDLPKGSKIQTHGVGSEFVRGRSQWKSNPQDTRGREGGGGRGRSHELQARGQ